MKYEAQPCGCKTDIGSSKAHQPHLCEHGELYFYTKQPKRSGPIRRVSKKREGEVRRRGSTLKRGRGFAVTPAQRKKVHSLPCVVSGEDRFEGVTIHPAHLWDRSRGGCDDPLCVAPLRADLHRLYDEHKLNLLPFLISRGYWKEMAHVIEAHEVSPAVLTERLSSGLWVLENPPHEPTKEAVTTGCPDERSSE